MIRMDPRRSVASTAVSLALALLAGCSSGDAPGTAAETSSGAPPTCDPACLADIADRYRAAPAVREGASRPVAEDVRYTEDGQHLALTDGLWGTASEVGAYRQLF